MRRVYRLSFPEGLTHEAVIGFARALSTRPRHGLLRTADSLVIEAVGQNNTIDWYLACEARESSLVLGSLRGAVPSIGIAEIENPETPPISAAWELRLNTTRRPLITNNAEQVSAALLGALTSTRDDEVVILQWLIGPWVTRRVVSPPNQKHHQDRFARDQSVQNSEQARALREKRSEPLLAAVGRIGVRAGSPTRTRQLRQRVVGALQLTRAPGVGLNRRSLPSALVASRLRRHVQPAFGWPSILNAAELASLLGWPIGNPDLDGVSYGGHRQLRPSRELLARSDGKTKRVTGRATSSRGSLVQLPAEAATRHLHVLGPTGVGKTTLLANLALADIEAGRGTIVIDPSAKGDLVGDLADRIPERRIDSTIVFDPADEAPVGLNLLGGDDPELVADGVVHVFRELWSAHWGPRTADVLHHAVLTLARADGMTLCELPPLLLHDGFRRQVLAKIGNDALGVGPFWSWYQALSDAERVAVTGPVLNKLRAFTQRPAIRALIGQAEGLDLGDVLSRRQVLLVNLSPSTLGEEGSQLLGALMVSSLWRALTQRGRLAAGDRHPCFVYIDEFQKTLRLPLDLADASVQARGLGVGLILAHQHLGQLTPEIRAGVLANAGSRIVFGLRAADATVMAKELGGGLEPSDIQNLPAFATYQSLHVGEGRSRPASVTTLPMTPARGTEQRVRECSRAQYGTPRQAVDEQLLDRRQTSTPEATIGQRRRRGGRS